MTNTAAYYFQNSPKLLLLACLHIRPADTLGPHPSYSTCLYSLSRDYMQVVHQKRKMVTWFCKGLHLKLQGLMPVKYTEVKAKKDY